MLQPLNVKPGPPIYVEEAKVHAPGHKHRGTLQVVLRGIVFTFVSVLLCRYIYTFTSQLSRMKGGRINSINTRITPEQAEHKWLQDSDTHDDD